MIACDVNVLVGAWNADDPHQGELARWLEGALNGDEPVALAGIVLSAFVRIMTHPRIMVEPLGPGRALDLAEQMRAAPRAVSLEPGPRHWDIFGDLCRRGNARGNAVPDAYLAALAIESGCEWLTADRGFGRYPGLRWRNPLDS